MMKTENDFTTEGLTAKQKKIAKVITKLIKQKSGGREPSGGGCKAFYTPKEWKERGEEYGTTSELILVHDGGDMAPYCNWDYCSYEMVEALSDVLRAEGYFVEQCTSWYSAVYEV